MAFDAHKNLAISTVAVPPSPATSGTQLYVTAGEGPRFPAPPFNATVWPASQPPTPANAELVRVTGMSGDLITTMVRATEGSQARSIVAGDLIAATITAKVITDIESGVNFPAITTAGAVTGAHFGISGNIYFSGAVAHTITLTTNDGADTGAIHLAGGGTPDVTRGGYISVWGNEGAAPGQVQLLAGNTATGQIQFITGPASAVRGAMYPSGGMSWGGTTDPGVGALLVGASTAAGQNYLALNPFANGLLQIGLAISTAANAVIFNTPSGIAGYIQTVGTTTTYATTSDARLKTDRGLLTDPEVLRATRVHHFTWNADGTVGRGVFAQEAITVLPSAVSVGSDDEDAQGRLVNPWGVDYAKYVPDLIAGWQYHDAQVVALKGQVTELETAVAVLQAQVARLLARIG